MYLIYELASSLSTTSTKNKNKNQNNNNNKNCVQMCKLLETYDKQSFIRLQRQNKLCIV